MRNCTGLIILIRRIPLFCRNSTMQVSGTVSKRDELIETALQTIMGITKIVLMAIITSNNGDHQIVLMTITMAVWPRSMTRDLSLEDITYDDNHFLSVLWSWQARRIATFTSENIVHSIRKPYLYRLFTTDSCENKVEPMFFVPDASRPGSWIDNMTGIAANHYGVHFRLARSDGATIPSCRMQMSSTQIVFGYFMGRHNVSTKPELVPDLQQAPDVCRGQGWSYPTVTKGMALMARGHLWKV